MKDTIIAIIAIAVVFILIVLLFKLILESDLPLWARTIVSSMSELTVEVVCRCCGMKFTHTQHLAYSKVARIEADNSFLSVWNRRADNG